MNHANVKILPRPHSIEFKCVGGLIFDINYVDYFKLDRETGIDWLNSKEQYHREDGPARIWENGDQFWYRYNELHREDGPVGNWNDGEQAWYLNDIEYTEEKFNKEIRRRNELRESNNLTNTL